MLFRSVSQSRYSPALTKGKGPLELISMFPGFMMQLDWKATMIGVVSFLIMMFWNKVPVRFLKAVPAPLVVLSIAIPAELLMDFQKTEPAYALVHLGNLADYIRLNVDFGGIQQTGEFIRYVIMFALVGSLESLLTVKAIDMLDPFKRKSNVNKDLIAVGVGNLICSVLGGLPMISEVARSSANVANGAKTRWANFFHGFFILTFVLLASSFIELIPNTALAAMLITVGIKLAHPKEFVHMLKIGREQLLIFCVTIFFTLYEDLLVGIFAGMAVKMIIHMINGASFASFFKVNAKVSFDEGKYLVEVDSSAVFTNYLGLKKKLDEIPGGLEVTIDLSNTRLVDHSVMENLHRYKHEYEAAGGKVEIVGLDSHKSLSTHELSAKKKPAK